MSGGRTSMPVRRTRFVAGSLATVFLQSSRYGSQSAPFWAWLSKLRNAAMY